MRDELSEKTKVPISLILVLGGLLFWVGVSWGQIQEGIKKQAEYDVFMRLASTQLTILVNDVAWMKRKMQGKDGR